tara:strand:- start:3152 stop:4006 length:855 start_codon:yes stop_codon:yes gene_type:complete
MTAAISLYEVGPRDGLQSLDRQIPRRKKVKLVKMLRRAGIDNIEIGSLVHPSVTSMRESEKIFKKTGGDLLVLNQRGLQRALVAGATSVNVSISTSESFIAKNQNTSYEEAKLFYERVATIIPINRLYISCCFSPDVTEDEILKCVEWGKTIASCIVLCDTDSNAKTEPVMSLCKKAKQITPNIAVHFHLTDQVEECVQTAYDAGIRVYDCSIGGLGGCFSLENPEGNVSTEALVEWAERNGIPLEQTIKPRKLNAAGKYAYGLQVSRSERFTEWLYHKIGMYI